MRALLHRSKIVKIIGKQRCADEKIKNQGSQFCTQSWDGYTIAI